MKSHTCRFGPIVMKVYWNPALSVWTFESAHADNGAAVTLNMDRDKAIEDLAKVDRFTPDFARSVIDNMLSTVERINAPKEESY